MMPSSDALCASAGPGTMSPIAHTPSLVVFSAPSTLIEPALVGLHAGLLEAEPLHVGAAPGGDADDGDIGAGRA